jgi:predicted aspartyl protease
MGEDRAEVELTNTIDEGMVRRGLLKAEDVRRVKASALVDTGAVNCVVPSAIAERLGLARPLKQLVQYADGRTEEVPVTEPVLFKILERFVYEECLVLGDEVTIGQTALASTDLHVDCRDNRVLPNPDHPDQPVIKIR